MLRLTRSFALWGAAAALLFAASAGVQPALAESVGVQATTPAPKELPSVETASLFPIGNRADVTLEPRHYLGKFFIEAYGVTISGVPGSVIDGDVYILANSFKMSGVTVDGSVSILGSNADLTGCKISGKVVSRGANNKW